MTFWVQAGLALIDSVEYYFHDFDTGCKTILQPTPIQMQINSFYQEHYA